MSIGKMSLSLKGLVVFRNLIEDNVIKKFIDMLDAERKTTIEQVSTYSDFCSELFKSTDNFTEYILDVILKDVNFYVLLRAKGVKIDNALRECVLKELEILYDISQFKSEEIKKNLAYEGYLPNWKVSEMDYAEKYVKRMSVIAKEGYGIFSLHHMFTFRNGKITPVKSPDGIRLIDLKGYEHEKKLVVDNTMALLSGKKAMNVLLYGDAGTGKSSTVKALANDLYEEGLRLIQVTKDQIFSLPDIIDDLKDNPLKFILFLDDISFDREGEDFNYLKAVLEGSVFLKADNLLIYATSNRRHMVRESFSDRQGDDVHINETIEELCSLYERFGLAVGYFKPDKALYLEIVIKLAEEKGLEIEASELESRAEKYALQRGGRSGRIARQFIDSFSINNEVESVLGDNLEEVRDFN